MAVSVSSAIVLSGMQSKDGKNRRREEATRTSPLNAATPNSSSSSSSHPAASYAPPAPAAKSALLPSLRRGTGRGRFRTFLANDEGGATGEEAAEGTATSRFLRVEVGR